MLYPRDPSLDPQLVWKGKDEQDRQDLAVPVVPVYIQEKIHPQALSTISAPHSSRLATRADSTCSPTSTACPKTSPSALIFTITMATVEPHDPGRLALGDDQPGRERRAQGQGADAFTSTRPTASSSARTGRSSTRKRDVKDGKAEARHRQPEQVRASPRHLETGHPFATALSPRPAGRRPRTADRDRQRLRADWG